MRTARPVIGIEEEHLVVHPETRHAVPHAPDLLAAVAGTLGAGAAPEFTRLQVEIRTPPTAHLTELDTRLRAARKEITTAARSLGLAVVASGLPVLGDVVPPPISEGKRYAHGMAVYGALHDEISICALHAHIDVDTPEQGVYVGNHLRPWLPTLLALSANSPFFSGRDTGYSSWRTITWGRWPVAGPPPYFASMADHERALDVLTASGALVDPATVFWDVRPSPHLPTVEVRVADVPAHAGDSITLAGVIRAMVVTALHDIDRGDLGPPVAAEILRAAYWRAARDGLSGHALDPLSGALLPARTLAQRLLDRIRPALEAAGDLAAVRDGVAAILRRGTGATRQRLAHARRGHLADVVDDLIQATAE
ncbi:carboxylate-amine ligase [Sinosporangium album]|uniref:Putative glutamate--cysteine ligase 2 n=1 Tax=Sinosporangium album TaxID=504805 RepID=A0A1G7RZ94_9ACTN|nr:glutamate--cysteine ligase [Sinosporangium album]SDG16095.1 carboxylate-amine ligase [Sinosporangium album]